MAARDRQREDQSEAAIAKSCLSYVEGLLTIQVLRRGTGRRSPGAIHSFAGYADTAQPSR
jgi:hypothetical protein